MADEETGTQPEIPTRMTRSETFSVDPKTGEPVLRIQEYAGGSPTTLRGDEAMANVQGPEGDKWRIAHPYQAVALKYKGAGTQERSMSYQAGKGLRNTMAYDGNALSRFFTESKWGPVGYGLLGGTALGGVGSLLLNMLGLDSNPLKGLGLGALLGGLGGGIYSLLRGPSTAKSPSIGPGNMGKIASFEKSAAMYHDPRNFVLEKLQSATDISTSMKAHLASKIRSMDIGQAKRLMTVVRSAVGFGVGAIIARFFFGKGVTRMLAGGMTGLMGANLLNAAHKAVFGTRPTPFRLYGQPKATYADLMRTGFYGR